MSKETKHLWSEASELSSSRGLRSIVEPQRAVAPRIYYDGRLLNQTAIRLDLVKGLTLVVELLEWILANDGIHTRVSDIPDAVLVTFDDVLKRLLLWFEGSMVLKKSKDQVIPKTRRKIVDILRKVDAKVMFLL